MSEIFLVVPSHIDTAYISLGALSETFWVLRDTLTEVIEQCFRDRTRIRLLFGFRNVAEYEYEYYSGIEIWQNTNMNTIRALTFGRTRIRILFGVPILCEYEYEYFDYLISIEHEYE